METAIIKAVRFNGYKIDLHTNFKGKPCASLSKFITVGKNKDTYQRIEGYYFATEARREEWCKEKIANIKANVSEKETKKAAVKELRNNYVNPFKVGEVYYDSWGYDQTNIDFYLIVEVKDKSVMLQKVGSIMCEGGRESGMSSNVKPDINKKIGKPFIKIVQVRIWNDVPTFFIRSTHGWISKYDRGDKGVYSSWYA